MNYNCKIINSVPADEIDDSFIPFMIVVCHAKHKKLTSKTQKINRRNL